MTVELWANPPGEVHSISPDGRYCVRVMPWEARNTLWVYSPCIVDTQQGTSIFCFSDNCWSLDHSAWLSDTIVRLELRKFPGDRLRLGVGALLDCREGVARLDGKEWVALSRFEVVLEAMIERDNQDFADIVKRDDL